MIPERPLAPVSTILDDVRKPTSARLEIASRIGSGGMGAVDLAVDPALGRSVAIKTLHPHLRSDDPSVRMFLREARLTGLLDHPHIVPVYDIAERDDGRLFFVMKLVEGRTLSEMIRALPRGVLDTATLYTLLDVIAKVCDALAFAHSRGVIHCDVKPANVMVGEFGQVFLMDWGIARVFTPDADGAGPASSASRDRISSARAAVRAAELASGTDDSVLGTPGYMSPEQARGDRKDLDVRSDVFLVGAMLYELLARRPPYASPDRGETLALAAAGAFPSPRKIAGDAAVPRELERIVLRAMERSPDDRYPSVAALRDDLVRFMRGGAEFPRRSFDAGDAVVHEGAPGDAAYIIVEGVCEIRKASPSGEHVVRQIGPGDVFGEMAILTEGPRTATVVAIEPTTVLVITAQVLEQELAALKPWMARLLKSLASRFRDADTQSRLSFADAPSPARMANQILMMLTTWGNADAAGGLTMPWSVVAPELEAQLGAPPIAIFSVIARYGCTLDADADRLTIHAPEELRERLARELFGGG